MSSKPSARSSGKSPWQLARVIDKDLSFNGKLLWVKGPPEWLTVEGREAVRTIRTNVRIRGRYVYIALASVELTRHMGGRIYARDLPRDITHPRDLGQSTYRKPPTVKPHVIDAARFKGCFAQEGRHRD
jgi:hypothetical protein